MARSANKGKQSNRKPAKRAPVLVRVDSVVVTIRFSPQKVNRTWYHSWIVDYSLHGTRCRDRKRTFRNAKTWANAIAIKLANGDMEALALTGQDRRIYLAALQNIKKLKVALDAATREYADTKRIVKNADLREVGRFYQKYAQKGLKKIKVPDLVKKMIADLEADKRGEYHLRDLEVRLGRFAVSYPGYIDNITGSQIDGWLRGLKSLARTKKGQGIAGKTRNNYRNAIVELFNYARKNGYLPKDLGTEAAGTTRVHEIKKDNEIFLPDQMDDLLNVAPVRMVPGMAIKAFSGVRTEEICEMDYVTVSLKKGYIILPRRITKSKRRRIIPIPPNLRKWLEPFDGLTIRICWRWSTPQSIFQAWDRVAKRLKIKAGANRFRNSFITYRVAQTGDIKKTSLESGNSPRDIQDNYLELATDEEADAWFSISPSEARLKALRAHAEDLKRRLALELD
ncbi:MAG: site-specific integrase [Verrucomicrobiae bacterium]|nr:site-specific integrase [Verrucomicrobiae bacterium]